MTQNAPDSYGEAQVSDSSDRLPPTISGVPKLVVSRRLREMPPEHDPSKEYLFQYRDKHHFQLPHVIKFSGGRSSGMLLFTLLENKILNPERGDIIIFNNTSCEHPYTYDFVRECKSVSTQYGIPFFIVEFQTYEDARKGEWTRLPSYRLVNEHPRGKDNLDGFHWKGEVFEELMSWTGFVPNQFRRICTANMKLEATRHFLRDWLAFKDAIPRLGHFGSAARSDGKAMYLRHIRNRGEVPQDIFLAKKAYSLSRPYVRPDQKYIDFSAAWRPVHNELLAGKSLGDKAIFGEDGVEYIAFVGLRNDEPLRVGRVKERNNGPAASGYEGEHIYTPLADMHVVRSDVNNFWDRQGWDLALPREGALSNCVYCFLKGTANLRQVHSAMEEAKRTDGPPGYGSLRGTPCDLDWWKRMEGMYGRDLVAENRETRVKLTNDFLGFFGTNSKFSYDVLSKANHETLERYSADLLPCDCTE